MKKLLENILSEKNGNDRQFVTALSRGLMVLEAFHPNCGPLGNQDIAKLTGLPKSTISRLTYTLSKTKFLNFLPSIGKYELGLPILNICNAMLSNMQIRKIVNQSLQEIATYADASVGLAERFNTQMIYVHSCVGRTSHALSINVGTSVSIGSTSLGCALMAALPNWNRDEILAKIKSVKNSAEFKKIKLLQETTQEEYVSRGFCVVDGGWRRHIAAVAVPLYIKDLRYEFAINCAGPAINMSMDRMVRDLGPRLLIAKHEIESQIQAKGIF